MTYVLYLPVNCMLSHNFIVTRLHSLPHFLFQCSQASYHLFHLHLDLRWYHFTILHQLVKCQSLLIVLDDTQQNGENHRLVDRNVLEENILLLLSDLIVIAIDKFERVR